VPTGNEDNFQGLGDVVLTPLLALSRSFGAYELHANLGLDVNADDLERNRLRYGAGAAYQALGWLSLFADIVGSSAFRSDRFTEDGVSGRVDRTDIVDGAAGLQIYVPANVLLSFGAIVPITDDGLRPEAIPFGSVEVAW
jgi:hypothetical protein